MSENKIPYKIYLSENEIPSKWYNLRADMKNKPAPLLNPATLKPMTAEELAPVFCEELIAQELNNTDAYIRNVCNWTGFGCNQHLTETEWPRLVQAMARQECGTNLSEEIINQGFKLYKTQP